jgi:hypothetical protein
MLDILAAIGVIGFVIYQQLVGQALRGKKVVLLPLIVTVIGATELSGHGLTIRPADVVCLAIGCVLAIVIGLAFGAIMHLESRDGVLWAKMPVKGLWLWLALFASPGVVYAIAAATHAHVAESTASILLGLGLNRLAQAAVVVPRALSAGVPFAPEKDGKTFMAGVLGQPAARPQGFDAYTDTNPVTGVNTDPYQYGPSANHVDLGTYRPDSGDHQDERNTQNTYQEDRWDGRSSRDERRAGRDERRSGRRHHDRDDRRTRFESAPLYPQPLPLPRNTFNDGPLPATDWRRVAATATDRLGRNR